MNFARPASKDVPSPGLVGWGTPATTLAAAYLEPRGSTLGDFESAGGEVVANASPIDPIYPPGPAAVFNFYDPFTGSPFTWMGRDGGLRPFCRIRPLGNRRGDAAKFLQPKDSGTHVYYARHPTIAWPVILNDPSRDLVMTEGETRSLAGVVQGLAVISITGVNCGQQDGKLHPDLTRVNWRGRRVFFAFDSDVRTKPKARKAIEELAGLLRQHGAQVFDVPIMPNPDGSKQGLDDYLAVHGRASFEALANSRETRPMEGAGEHEPPVLLADLMATDYPPTEWVWDGLILKGEVNLLSGDGGVGKSLLALHLALAVAAGCHLLSGATIQMPVLTLWAEDGPAQVQLRSRTIMRDLKLGHELPIKMWCQPRGETALAQIDDNGSVTELPRLHALRSELSELHGQGFTAFVVLDSLADLFAMNESLRLPVNAALKQVLGGLCKDFAATVLVLMHPSKTSMQDGTHYSGSTAFNNAVRQRLTLEAEGREKGDTSEGQPPRTLKVAKSNYGPLIQKSLWYVGGTISDTPLVDGPASLVQADRLSRACVAAAVTAAKLSVPFTMQRSIPDASLDEIAKSIGRRPKQAEVKRELHNAVHAGLLRYQAGTNKARAGYYPADDAEGAKMLARQSRLLSRQTREGSP